MDRLKEIDGLRAIAVIAVIIYHYKKEWLPLGYLGVDIFFVISGYVITKSILDGVDSRTFTFHGFFLRRAKRLLPALALVVIATLLLASMLLPGKSTFATALAAFFGLSNLWFWYSGFDYFAVSTEWNPLTHTWSLGVEEQFYLFFPFLLVWLVNRQKRLIWIISALGLGSLVAYSAVWDQSRIAAFYLSPLRFWELVAGAVVFLIHRDRGFPNKTEGIKWLKLMSMGVMLYILFVPNLFEVAGTLVIVGATCVVLYLIEQSKRGNLLLENEVSQYIGRISYSLYLWHWPVAVFLKLTTPTEVILPIYVLATAVLAAATFHFIERPLRHGNWSIVKNRFPHTFLAYSVIVLIMSGGIFYARTALYVGSKERQEVQFLRLSPCHIPGPDGLDTCLSRSATNRRTVWLFGDSHAGNFMVGVSKAAEQLSLDFKTITGRSLFNSLSGQCVRANDCPEGGHLDLTRRLASVANRGDIAMVSFARDRFGPDNRSILQFEKNLLDFVKTLQSLGLVVVFIEDIPKVCRDDGEYLMSEFQESLCQTSSEKSILARKELSQIYLNIKRQLEVVIVDPHNLLCRQSPDGVLHCTNYIDSRLIYLDASPHLTRKSSGDLSGFFVEALKALPSQ